MENPNPTVFAVDASDDDDSPDVTHLDAPGEDPVTPQEIYRTIRTINDPEHPLTLDQLNVVRPEHIFIQLPPHPLRPSLLTVFFTPTIPHCSMAALIGLCIRVKLERSLPCNKFNVKVRVREGSHQSEADINKQLEDKERVAAALENEQLAAVVGQCLVGPPRVGIGL